MSDQVSQLHEGNQNATRHYDHLYSYDGWVPVPEGLNEHELAVWTSLVKKFQGLGVLDLEYSPCIDLLAIAWAMFLIDSFCFDLTDKNEETIYSFPALNSCFRDFGCHPDASEAIFPPKTSVLDELKDLEDE